MTESWKARLGYRSNVGVVVLVLSKTFGGLNHQLQIAKFEAYGLDKK